MNECRALLFNETALSALAMDDRKFLQALCERLLGEMDALSPIQTCIHGDAGVHNVLITPGGAIYGDLEDVCRGPREWDLGWLPESDLQVFGPIDRESLAVCSALRSLCVSVWCFKDFDRPGKRDAAIHHFNILKRRF